MTYLKLKIFKSPLYFISIDLSNCPKSCYLLYYVSTTDNCIESNNHQILSHKSHGDDDTHST